jgi:hypothetical protein
MEDILAVMDHRTGVVIIIAELEMGIGIRGINIGDEN